MQNDNYSRHAQKLNLQHLINNTNLNHAPLPLRESNRHNFDISDELASLRKEFRNFKDSIKTKISDDLSQSDDYSINNSAEKPRTREKLTEDRDDLYSTYRTGKFEDLDNTGSFSTTNKHATPTSVSKTEPILTVQEYETDYKKSPSVSRQNTSIPEMSRFDEDISEYDKSMYWNPETDNVQSVITDVKSIFENKPFIVMSKLNDINNKKVDNDLMSSISDASSFSIAKRKDVKNIMQKYEEEAIKSKQQINGLLEFKNEVSKLMKGIKSPHKSPDRNIEKDPLERKKIKYREVEVYPQEKPQVPPRQEDEDEPILDNNALQNLFRKRICNSIGQEDSEEIYLKKKMELLQMNNRLLENDEPQEDDDDEVNNSQAEVPVFKKTLSVIFSTNESIESSNISQNASRQNLLEKFDNEIIPAERNAVRKKGSFADSYCEYPEARINVSTEKIVSRSSSTKEFENHERNVNSVASHCSTRSEDENVLSLVQMIKFQHRGNRDLEEKLSKLMDVYSSYTEKQEEKLNDFKQKNEKLAQTNELLIKTLKNCEKEVDNLAQTNSNLHKNLVFLQTELNKRENTEDIKKLAQNQREQMKHLRQDLEKKTTENEELHRKLLVCDAKVTGLTAYTKSCEDSICAINVTLKKLMQRSNMKAATPALYKVLSSIVDETTKFVDKLDTSCEADVSKPMNSKPSSYFESGSDNSISFERENTPVKRASPRVSPSRVLQEQKKTNYNILHSNLSPLSNKTLKSTSSNVSIATKTYEAEKKDTPVRSTSAIGKRDRGREKEIQKENLHNNSYKSSRKEKSAPNLRSTSPNFAIPAKSNCSEIDDKIKDNLRKRLMNNLKVQRK